MRLRIPVITAVKREDWKEQNNRPPLWRDDDSERGQKIGTLPYMSGEILASTKYPVSPYISRATTIHSSIHDLDSAFWVLSQLCLTF